jgi:hypothetical protein
MLLPAISNTLPIGRLHRRDSTAVHREYEDGNWLKVLREERWKTCPSVESYVTPGGNEQRIATINDRLVRLPSIDYYQFRLERIQALLLDLAGDTDHIAELGCGWGINLLSASLTRRWRTLLGFDVSHNAVAALNAAAKYFGINEVHAEQMDLRAPKHSALAAIRDRVAYTYLSLEQLKYDTPLVIANILRGQPKRVFHVEPTPEILSLRNPRQLLNRLYIQSHDYQDNLVRTLEAAEKRGELRILSVERLGYSPLPFNDPTLVCWEPA